jgi:hypothetical protein
LEQASGRERAKNEPHVVFKICTVSGVDVGIAIQPQNPAPVDSNDQVERDFGLTFCGNAVEMPRRSHEASNHADS